MVSNKDGTRAREPALEDAIAQQDPNDKHYRSNSILDRSE